MYDSRLGRWWSLDNYKLAIHFQSAYLFCSNSPVSKRDNDGNFDLPSTTLSEIRGLAKLTNRITYTGVSAEIGAGLILGFNGKVAMGMAFAPNGNMALVFTGGGFNHVPGDLFTPEKNPTNGNFILGAVASLSVEGAIYFNRGQVSELKDLSGSGYEGTLGVGGSGYLDASLVGPNINKPAGVSASVGLGAGVTIGAKELTSLVIEFHEQDLNQLATATYQSTKYFAELVAKNNLQRAYEYMPFVQKTNVQNISYTTVTRFVTSNVNGNEVIEAFVDIVQKNSKTGQSVTLKTFKLFKVTQTTDTHFIFENAQKQNAQTSNTNSSIQEPTQ